MGAPEGNYDTRTGMIGGLLFVFLGLKMGELVRTAILAAIGAAVSFLVTLCCKWIIKKWKTKG